jgi:hypothetical protein
MMPRSYSRATLIAELTKRTSTNAKIETTIRAAVIGVSGQASSAAHQTILRGVAP